ncbi:MAG: coenzyme F420-0:L-glutamate ligase [PVC group bacterium]
MARTLGTVVRGIRAPVVKRGDDIVETVVRALDDSRKAEKYDIRDRDVIGVTESLVARAQGNYVTVDDIAGDVKAKFGGEVGVVFPILSRNRFSIILRGIARGVEKVILLLNYPADEVGNTLMSADAMIGAGLNPYTDVLTEERYREICGTEFRHPFTGIDYVRFYREIVESEGTAAVFIFANDPRVILRYTGRVLAADIHSRRATKRALREAGAEVVFGLDDICREPAPGRGCNRDYGLLGSNKSTEERLKLFPRVRDERGRRYVEVIQSRLKDLTGKTVEVLIYGDGAFKDPAAGIWELADPVVCPDFTEGLRGVPGEIKMKYLIDNEMGDLAGEEAAEAVRIRIRGKGARLVGLMASQGTTPRQLSDLLGSLCDLTSGSGDKGTPVILIQGYFDSYASE